MYYYFHYINFQEEYLRGIKRIKQITSYPRLTLKGDPSLQLKQASYSYVIFFNKKGKLIHAINLQTKNKYYYTFDKFGNLNRILEVSKDTNQLISENRLKYNFQRKILQEDIKESIGYNGATEKISYIYKGSKVISIKTSDKEESKHIITETYNDKKQLIELKLEDDDGIISFEKFEYNSKGQEILMHDADEDGTFTIEDSYETTYYENGLIKSYSNTGINGFVKIYEYVYDEKGNWIQKTLYNDDIPQYLYERELEYY